MHQNPHGNSRPRVCHPEVYGQLGQKPDLLVAPRCPKLGHLIGYPSLLPLPPESGASCNISLECLTVLQRSEQIAKWVELANKVSSQVATKPQGAPREQRTEGRPPWAFVTTCDETGKWQTTRMATSSAFMKVVLVPSLCTFWTRWTGWGAAATRPAGLPARIC